METIGWRESEPKLFLLSCSPRLCMLVYAYIKPVFTLHNYSMQILLEVRLDSKMEITIMQTVHSSIMCYC